MRCDNILWVASPMGYSSIISGYTVHNKSVTDYRTNEYAHKIINIYKNQAGDIYRQAQIFINKTLCLNIKRDDIHRKLGKPSFCINNADSGRIMWEKTKLKDSNGNRIIISCGLTDSFPETAVFYSETAQKKPFLHSLRQFLSSAEIKTNK